MGIHCQSQDLISSVLKSPQSFEGYSRHMLAALLRKILPQDSLLFPDANLSYFSER